MWAQYSQRGELFPARRSERLLCATGEFTNGGAGARGDRGLVFVNVSKESKYCTPTRSSIEAKHRVRIEAKLIINRIDKTTRDEPVEIWRTVIQVRHIPACPARDDSVNQHAPVARENHL